MKFLTFSCALANIDRRAAGIVVAGLSPEPERMDIGMECSGRVEVQEVEANFSRSVVLDWIE